MAGLTGLLPAQADEFVDSTTALCEKAKSCALAQVHEVQMTPEMLRMLQPMLDQMCTRLNTQIEQVPAAHPLYEPALDCMNSLQQLDCDALQSLDDAATPACRRYEQLAAKAYDGK